MRTESLMLVNPLHQLPLTRESCLVVTPRARYHRIGKQPIANCMCLPPASRIQDREIEPAEEFSGVWLHDVPRRIAQHRIETAATQTRAAGPEHLRECQVPRQCLAPRRKHRCLTICRCV